MIDPETVLNSNVMGSSIFSVKLPRTAPDTTATSSAYLTLLQRDETGSPGEVRLDGIQSETVPSGHIHPHQARPIITAEITVTTPSSIGTIIVLPAIIEVIPFKGSRCRKRLYGNLPDIPWTVSTRSTEKKARKNACDPLRVHIHFRDGAVFFMEEISAANGIFPKH